VVASALILATGVFFTLKWIRTPDRSPTESELRSKLAAFALVWAAMGWLPLLSRSISWHAYYGCLGALGAWLAIALFLERWPGIAVAMVLGLALLRGAEASVPSWDWGSEWYQRRAGEIQQAIHDELLREHPTLPSHSRVYLAHIPNNVGLIAGRSPALRVWYRDTTLQAGFYSTYRPRAEGAPKGADYFFRLDTLSGMVEVHAGPEDLTLATEENPGWERDHMNLALLFLHSGDVKRAAEEFEKLSQLPPRGDACVYASVCREALGDRDRADSLLGAAEARLRLSRADVEAWAKALRDSMPGR
jgi:hypothetical protein